MKIRYMLVALSLLFCNMLGAQIVKEVPGAVLWLRADQGVISDDRGLLKGSCWRDLCGNHTFKPVGDSREYPAFLVQNVLNGKPVVRFQGKFALKGNSYYAYKTVFAVGKVNNGGTLIGMYNPKEKSERPKSFFSNKQNSKQVMTTYINDGDVPVGGACQSGYRCFTGVFSDELKAQLFANGSLLVESGIKKPLGENFLLIGASAELESGEPYLTLIGDIAEIIAYPFELTKEQREKVEQYLIAKYNLNEQAKQDDAILESAKVFGESVNPRFDKPSFPANVPTMPQLKLQPQGEDDVYGLVYADGKPIQGVVVTDGFNVTTTDAKGYYGIKRNPKARMVYMTQPAGYQMGMRNGQIPFFAYLTEAKQRADFALAKVDDSKHIFIAMGDPQPSQKWEMDRFTYETMKDVREFAAKQKVPVAMMCLGDMGWDNQICYNDYKYAIETGGVPAYGVIGNHDHNQFVKNDEFADINWQRNNGPSYYSFNMGKIHYVVLDNINYTGRDKYTILVNKQQLEWLAKDLQFVPKGSTLVVGMHASVFNRIKMKPKIPNHAEIMALLQDYKVHFVTGHTHVMSTIEFEKEKFEHNVGAACGAWWRAQVATDGAPHGYEVFEMNGDKINWWYKSVNYDKSYQMRAYDFTRTDWITQHKPVKSEPGTILTPENDGTQRMRGVVVLNVWDWEPACKVEWKEDGVLKGEMTHMRTGALDPEAYRVGYAGGRPTLRSSSIPGTTDNLFYIKPSSSAKNVEFIFTNRFGEVFKSSLDLPATK